MRKLVIGETMPSQQSTDVTDWLDLEQLARVEMTSEDAAYPIEAALTVEDDTGWRASMPGTQTIRLLFDSPQKITRIQLLFEETLQQRTQEFVLRWLPAGTEDEREIVRQQYNFYPTGNTRELEDYSVSLQAAIMIELCITPDISGGDARASLAQLRIA